MIVEFHSQMDWKFEVGMTDKVHGRNNWRNFRVQKTNKCIVEATEWNLKELFFIAI